MTKTIFAILSILTLLPFKVDAGATFNCESIKSGDWGVPSTWSNCNDGVPNSSDKHVLIKEGHTINFVGLSRRIVYGLKMEANSKIIVPESFIQYELIAENDDIDTQLGDIYSDSRFKFTTNNGDIILGSVNSPSDNLNLLSSQNIIFKESINGFNVYSIYVQSTNSLGNIIIEEDINSNVIQNYDNNIVINNSVSLSGGIIRINDGLKLESHSLELNMSGNSYILGHVSANNAELIKSGSSKLTIDVVLPSEMTTIVNEGHLVINDQVSGPVILNAESELSGIGEINSYLTMNDMSDLSLIEDFQVNHLNMSEGSKISIWISQNSQGLLIVSQGMNIDGTLSFSMNRPYDFNEEIILIDNQGNDPVNGTFQGYIEGDIIFENFKISYQGGDGNDVTITSFCGDKITVTNNLDSGPGSFRAAVENVCPDGTIEFQNSYLITVDSTIDVDNNNGSFFLSIDASDQIFTSSGTHSIINFVDGSDVNWVGATFQYSATTEGAIKVYGSLNISNAYFKNNVNTSMSGGGAISNYGNTLIESSSFYQNNALKGGAINNEEGAVFLRNSTFYQNGNLLTNQGGSIYNNQHLELLNVTMVDSGNGSMTEGNSIYDNATPGHLRIINSVISNSKPSISECFGVPDDEFEISNTWIEDGSCDAPLSGEPLLGEWGDYGGITPVIPPITGSPLINSGFDLFCLHFPSNIIDQLGNARTYGLTCDIGAVEIIDITPPEVLELKVADQFVDVCSVIADEAVQLKVTFTEPVVNAENIFNYQLLHAGEDQSFLTTDDFVVEIMSVDSDYLHPTPTVTILTSGVIPNGLVRLLIDGEVADAFNLELYSGEGYQHPFRLDRYNVYQGGHFDECVGIDPLYPWSINTNNDMILGADKDNSNVSLSLVAEINEANNFTINQCVEVNEASLISMSLYMKDGLSPKVVNNDIPNIESTYLVSMSCLLYNEMNCEGIQLNTINANESAFNNYPNWQMIDFQLGLTDASTLSADCGLTINTKQVSNIQVQMDALRLELKEDLIYSNHFEIP